MLYYNNFYETLIYVFFYIFIYNLSLIIIFWTFFQFINQQSKTIYSFSDLKFNFFYTTVISFILFSIAGVPPFIGFFSKLLILIMLSKSNFFIFYIFFFILLFFGLYFYIQNIRFLYSTGTSHISYAYMLNMRVSLHYIIFTQIVLFVIIFGFFLIDDFLLYFYWLFC
uniref:NADH dehydrogenase subunit 2b n=1 Tax=Pseudourostyla cristata TaxID=293816 RepID=A0A4P9JLJ3_9SPIT|nr:NADH dehydrogenase subunit 2b [Pseudourostyla cristata]